MPKLVNFQDIKVNCNEKYGIDDLEEIVSDHSLQIKKNSLIPDIHREKITNFMLDLIKCDFSPDNSSPFDSLLGIKRKKPKTPKDKYEEQFVRLRRIHGIHPKKSQVYYLYRMFLYKNLIHPNLILEDLFITKAMRSQSGVLVISVIMPPDTFSCAYDCYYCPNDPAYSRSYYRGEPTVMPKPISKNFWIY